MLIRIGLLFFIGAIAQLVFVRRQRFPIHIVFVFLLLGLAALFVIFPEATSALATFMGVGRGADLVMYFLNVTLLYVVVHYYTKFVEIQSQITRLVREMALMKEERKQV